MRISDWSSDVCSSDLFPAQLSGFDYPARADNDDHAYRLQNSQFGEADARALFALLRHWQPQRLIEVGSGYSTLLAADINRRFRSEEHTSELQSLMRISYAVFCLKKKKIHERGNDCIDTDDTICG